MSDAPEILTAQTGTALSPFTNAYFERSVDRAGREAGSVQIVQPQTENSVALTLDEARSLVAWLRDWLGEA